LFEVYCSLVLDSKIACYGIKPFFLMRCCPGIYYYSLPELLPTVQEKLLDSISFVLAKAPYRTTRGGLALVRPATSPITSPVVECTGPALTQLALHTLTTFNLQVCEECIDHVCL
jgi:hypothetical protein